MAATTSVGERTANILLGGVDILGKIGIAGMQFAVEAGKGVRRSVDITEHYTPNQSFIASHAAIKPMRYNLVAILSEQEYPNKYSEDFWRYIPQMIGGAIGVGGVIGSIPLRANNPQGAAPWDWFNYVARLTSGITGVQSRMRAFLEVCVQERLMLGINTQWGFFSNMLIGSYEMTQISTSTNDCRVEIEMQEVLVDATRAFPADSISVADGRLDAPMILGDIAKTPPQEKVLLPWEEGYVSPIK